VTARDPLAVEKAFSVTALDFDPPITELVYAPSAGAARMKMARRAYDAGWYESLFDACRRMRAARVRAAEREKEENRG
jgi:hypothetical protein